MRHIFRRDILYSFIASCAIFSINTLYTIANLDTNVQLLQGQSNIMLATTIPIRQTDIGLNGFTITVPGSYKFVENIFFYPTASTKTAISIASDNVRLDLQGFSLVQGNATIVTSGIQVNSNISNVTVRNGIIRNMTNEGIRVNSNCKQIFIDSITTLTCLGRGIDFLGTSGNQIFNSGINNCNIFYCASQQSQVLNMENCSKVKVINCTVNSNGAAGLAQNVITVDTCNGCDFIYVNVINNRGTDVNGFKLSLSERCRFKKCIVRNNVATVTFNGFDFTANPSSTGNRFHIFEKCIVQQNTATNSLNGFFLEQGSQSNLFKKCVALGNSGGNSSVTDTVRGFRSIGTFISVNLYPESDNYKNVFIECVASRNSSTAALSVEGMSEEDSDLSAFIRCISADNTNSVSVATGMQHRSSFYVRQNSCHVMNNEGNTAANSFGVRLQNGPRILELSQYAFNNGTTAGNQFSGVNASSVSTPAASATNNINTFATRYWTNMAVEQ